jgi:hypothetical protein
MSFVQETVSGAPGHLSPHPSIVPSVIPQRNDESHVCARSAQPPRMPVGVPQPVQDSQLEPLSAALSYRDAATIDQAALGRRPLPTFRRGDHPVPGPEAFALRRSHVARSSSSRPWGARTPVRYSSVPLDSACDPADSRVADVLRDADQRHPGGRLSRGRGLRFWLQTGCLGLCPGVPGDRLGLRLTVYV